MVSRPSPMRSSMELTPFDEALTVSLRLTQGGKSWDVPAGDVKRASLDVELYGFLGEVEFTQQERKTAGDKGSDEIYKVFLKPDLMTVTLKIQSRYRASAPLKPPPPIVVTGIVTERALEEETFADVKKEPVLHRRYALRFADPMDVLWRQHWPTQLYTYKTFKDVLEDHKGPHLKLDHKWAPATVMENHLFLSCGIPDSRVSFYDLVVWFLKEGDGHLLYDLDQDTYTFGKDKGKAPKAQALHIDDVRRWRLDLGPVPRYKPQVLNASAASPKAQVIGHKDAVEGVRRDLLLRTDVAKDVDDRKAVEQQRLRLPGEEVHVSFAQMPTVDVRPGRLLTLDGPGWPASHLKGKAFRVHRLRLEAQAKRSGADDGFTALDAPMAVWMDAALEVEAEGRARLPAFEAPIWPLEVEGYIVSEKLEEKEETFHVYQDKKSASDQYHVEVQLWPDPKDGKKQRILAPFLPSQLSGQFFFPAYKRERVLVDMHFRRAEIRRFLDWRPGARLSNDTQGNHLFMGLTETDSTSIKHVYEQTKPVFQVFRRHEQDVGKIRIEEGTLILRIEEEKAKAKPGGAS